MMQVNLFTYNFKKISKPILFICFFIICFFSIQQLFIPYNIRLKRWYSFYEIPKNNLDIVFLGSSHSYTTYYSEMIDNKLKINSFNMASNSQHLDQLYFNLKEILKYQKPKIVFIELFSLSGNTRNDKGSYFVYDNLDGQKFSFNKITSILSYRKKEHRLITLFPLIRSHLDWKDPNKLFNNIYKKYKDENSLKTFTGFQRTQSEMDEEITKKYLSEKKTDYKNFNISDFNKNYLIKIRELSKKHNFKVIYLYSPMYGDFINPNYQTKYNKFKEIANLYADDLLDFNLIGKSIGMNERWFENGYINYQHTSFYGAKKITEYIINYLQKNYTFNNREKEKYWDLKNSDLKNIGYEQKIGENFELLPNIKIKEIIYTPQNKNSGLLEIRFSKDSDISKLKEYNLKIHSSPKNKSDKKFVKSFQNWDIGNIQKNLKSNEEYFYINRNVNPIINNYILNIALFQIKKDKNNKVIGYPNFGNQLYIDFNI